MLTVLMILSNWLMLPNATYANSVNHANSSWYISQSNHANLALLSMLIKLIMQYIKYAHWTNDLNSAKLANHVT